MLVRLLRRIRGRLGPALLSDVAFLEQAYREVLGRAIDGDGLAYYRRVLRDGGSRVAVLMSLVRSEEFTSKLARRGQAVARIRGQRPERYRLDEDLLSRTPALVFEATQASDFDWLESMLASHGYYERPGVWNFDVDMDKRVMAEMLSAFSPQRALEIGCASGAVLHCLEELAIVADGVEISRMAIEKAYPEVKGRIREGDLLAVELQDRYELIYGLDVFEHLNPNRLSRYLARLRSLCAPGGYVFANIPAFGPDPGFGTVFPLYLRAWSRETGLDRPFMTLHVDEDGYPLHGHLIWAESAWWVKQFEAQGLRRELEIERALHARYDAYMDKRSLARKAYYVFSNEGDPGRSRAIAERIRATPSRVV